MDEALSKAEHGASYMSGMLRTALREASALEGLVLLPLVERAAFLVDEIKALQSAREADARGKDGVNA